jgi:poly(A) polymerase
MKYPAQAQVSPDWLQSPAVVKIFATFAAHGAPVWAVGGCVRDVLMDRQAESDIDFATPLEPGKVNDIFVAAGLRTEPTGIEHGTVSVIIDHVAYEVTTLRRDVSTDGRRAVVAFTDDIRADAERRDFTFNALYMDAEGRIYDPWGFGAGVEDSKRRYLRFVGDADRRIQEDYLRILRLFRFQATLGCEIEPEALAACERHSEGLRHISGERVEKEMLKLLGAAEPVAAVDSMFATGVYRQATGDWSPGNSRRTPGHFTKLISIAPRDAVLRLAYLLNANIDQALERWRSSNELKDRARMIVRESHNFTWTDEEVTRRMFHAGRDAVISGAWIAAAKGLFPVENVKRWSEIEPPVFPVRGQDIVDAGVPRGAEVGVRLRALEAWWIAEGYPDRGACLARLHAEIPVSGA